MSEIGRYETEFVVRTREILTRYRGGYKLTNAINCTIGLIILPNEIINESHLEFWDRTLESIPVLNDLQIHVFSPIKGIKKGNIEYFPKTLRVFLQKTRNGLAHQNITPVNENGEFTGVVIKNYFGKAKPILDLEVEFNREQLERFSLFIADAYLNGN